MTDRPDAPDAGDATRRLIEVMARLRHPETGCPWDVQQDFRTIAPYTIEEAYEVADAIERDAMDELRDELGDLLFQVAFHSRMAEERGAFAYADVAAGIVDKMIRRHPHVFAGAEVDADGMPAQWERQKAEERAAKAEAEGRPAGVLDGIAGGLPSLTRALKLQKRAARVGFDWTDPADILDKIEEEVGEIRAEIDGQAPKDRIEDEIGDLLFCAVNLARRYEVDPDSALRRTNAKFERRFRHLEAALRAQGRDPAGATLDEMEALWVAAKRAETAG
ncbi:nucleoside triphosphate pyrophosphohydrolase [Inquilinus limosus]|uniref:Nucleoside triphosphate pyrophosphohydrolase n=1 Tax=Inquilinus limosus MP06 TaxID=1398085 RepID=A0A0A0D8T1_9PROT|nr:nucleoside triphosphate pyrophosphohydrolase [Inquilinus limosus]KGM35131.1 nucleoside triphosphate hydrolase [Inquilinus limosus MP06]